jgi:hypothetical protein
MAVVAGFKTRHPGRCGRCGQPYDVGTRITSTTPATVTPPVFAHHPACPPRAVFTSQVPADPDPAAHTPAQIGVHHEDGSRTHAPPGEVCTGCSDPRSGRWVPVNDCPIAYAAWRAEHDRITGWTG